MYQVQNKILSPDRLLKKVGAWKSSGDVIVFTNGCFDLIHLGHVDYLEKSRNLGSRLVIGLNTDASIKKIKGPDRPVSDQEARSRILASFVFVDAVVLFDEETPYNLIEAIKPDILVKGNDYLPENIVGAEIVKSYNGKIITIDLIQGYSTSGIIKKIKEQRL